MILLQMDIGSWLSEQAPVIVVMGVIIWWLARQLIKKDKQLEHVSEKTIVLATKFEEKCEYLSGKNKESHEEIMSLLRSTATDLSIIKDKTS